MPSWSEFERAAPELAEKVEPASASEPSHRFRLDLREVSSVELNADRSGLVIEVWTPEHGVRTMRR